MAADPTKEAFRVLTIAPAAESRRQELVAMYDIPEVRVMLACSGNHEEGGCTYAVEGDTVRLFRLWTDDSALQDGILRAVLNAGYLAGATRAVCEHESLEPLLHSEGFGTSEEGMTVDLTEFFSRPCRGAK